MMCRAPILTQEQIRHLTFMVRTRWVQLLQVKLAADLKGLPFDALVNPLPHPSVLQMVADIVEATDLFRGPLEALAFWQFHLNQYSAQMVQTLMTQALHEQFLSFAKNVMVATDNLSAETAQLIADLEAKRPEIIKLLEDAPYVDPHAAPSLPPAGRQSPNRN